MHAYRIEFQWQSALRGHETRARGFRANKGERVVFSRERYSAEALPKYRELIVSEAVRAGMKDVRVKITAVVGLQQRRTVSKGPGRQGVGMSALMRHTVERRPANLRRTLPQWARSRSLEVCNTACCSGQVPTWPPSFA